MGQILNEYDIGIYKGTRNIFSVLSIVGSVSNCSLEFVQKEKKRAEAAELSVAGERKYYVVCIPSSRQLKKYKIFVLPGWISGNIFMPPIVAFHEIPLVLRLQVLSVAGRLYSNLYIL